MSATHIQWTDETWNPVTGCTKVSPGCAHCYAERLAPRVFAGQTVQADHEELPGVWQTGDRPRRFTDVHCHPERLDAPLRWRKPRRVFVNSMSDLFHEEVPDDFIAKVWAVMALAEDHTFQVLTKRPERMRDWFVAHGALVRNDPGIDWPLPNVWLGVSVEDQRRADERIPVLLDTPAAVRFLSCEPLLGPVDIDVHLPAAPNGYHCERGDHDWSGPALTDPCIQCGLERDRRYIDWIIVGGESGPKARPMDLAWARSLVEQGHAAGVPVFVKQLGARPYGWEVVATPGIGEGTGGIYDRSVPLSLRHRAGGDPDEWPADLRVREFPR